jgi:hypothetical protein
MPHEYCGDVIDWDMWMGKYARRIERFRKIAKDSSIAKIFVRLDWKPSQIAKHRDLEVAVQHYCNGSVRFIGISDLVTVSNFTWKREYLDWSVVK